MTGFTFTEQCLQVMILCLANDRIAVHIAASGDRCSNGAGMVSDDTAQLNTANFARRREIIARVCPLLRFHLPAED
ncbi:hypothetical protein [Salmonella enterica]|uniref:hypothetical protein n=1 Tax=Salmonella enterica TaxID=28901 RepID=UPI003857CB58